MRTIDQASPTTDVAIDRVEVEHLVKRLDAIEWGLEGSVAMLVETPLPHRHAARDEVEVVSGKGFAGDHNEKSFYRGEYVPGREVSAIALETLRTLHVDPVVVGDNLITEGIDLGCLEEGDRLVIGNVVLVRSHRTHRPCATFRNRSSAEAFAAVSRGGYRGALFVVQMGGIIQRGARIRIERGSNE